MGKASKRKQNADHKAKMAHKRSPSDASASVQSDWVSSAAQAAYQETITSLSTQDPERSMNLMHLRVLNTIDASFDATRATLDQAYADGKIPSTVACRKGCSFCCYMRVTVFPNEVAPIVDYVERTFTPEEKTALAQWVQERLDFDEKLSSEEKIEVSRPCPFLVEGACSIYAVRPMLCRTMHSMDAKRCDFNDPAYDGITPEVAEFYVPAHAMHLGLSRAWKQKGLIERELEFIPAFDLCWQDPTVYGRWLKGEDAFIAAWDPQVNEYLMRRHAVTPLLRHTGSISL